MMLIRAAHSCIFCYSVLMPYDVKREQKNLYVPGKTPAIVEVPAMQFVAVRGAARRIPERAAAAVRYIVHNQDEREIQGFT